MNGGLAPAMAPMALLEQPAQPAGPQPGSITWKAQQLGVSPYMLALMQSRGAGGRGGAGQPGNQARLYLDTFLKRRSANLARSMAQSNEQATY